MRDRAIASTVSTPTDRPPTVAFSAEQPMHILIADDNDDLRCAAQGVLEVDGHVVRTARDGAEAMQLLDHLAETADVDLLITDVDMPKVDGLELLEHARRRLPTLPVVLTTADPGGDVLERLAQGDIAFVAKPFAPQVLLDALDEAEQRVRAPRPGVEHRSRPMNPGAGPSVSSEPEAAPAPTTRSRRLLLALAAILLMVVGAGLMMRSHVAPPLAPPIDDDAMRSLRVAPIAPIGALEQPPQHLEWTPVADASAYTVELRRIGRDLVWQDRLTAPPATLPAEVVAQLDSGVIFTWQVEAWTPDGARMAWSEAVRFQVESPGEPNAGDAVPVVQGGRGDNGS